MACVAGNVPCLENVFHWKEENTRPVRFDVIPGNDLWEDFDRINTLWGSSPGLVISANMRERNVIKHTSALSDIGKRNLCLALCREIVVHKTTLKHASNLNEEEKSADVMNGLFSVDITFEGPEHGGVGSTAFYARVVQDACNETGLPPERTPAVQVLMVLINIRFSGQLNFMYKPIH
jgi:hypothetical protein